MDVSSNQKRARRGAVDADPEVRQAVTAARRADRDALGYLYCRYGDRVYAEVLGIVVHPHEARNLTHELFATLATTLPAEEEPGVPFLAWAMQLASNMARDRLPSRQASSERDPTRGGSRALPFGARS